MIKFFRHIRKSLLMENKTSKYFKYAIGEIVLVVIGILIALQINNWNENRKLKLNEKVVVKSLIEDLQIDYDYFIEIIARLEKQLKIVDLLIFDPSSSKLKKVNLSYLRYNTDLFPISFEDNIPKDVYDKNIIEFIKTYYRDQLTIMDAKKNYSNVVLDMVRPYLRKYGVHNPKTVLEIDFDSDNDELLIEAKLSKQYGSDEFEQVLIELRLKTAEFIYDLDKLSKANKALIPILKEYSND